MDERMRNLAIKFNLKGSTSIEDMLEIDSSLTRQEAIDIVLEYKQKERAFFAKDRLRRGVGEIQDLPFKEEHNV